jgi:hypothetical protein
MLISDVTAALRTPISDLFLVTILHETQRVKLLAIRRTNLPADGRATKRPSGTLPADASAVLLGFITAANA